MSSIGLRRIGRIRPKRSDEIAHSPWGINFFVPRSGTLIGDTVEGIDDLAQRVAELGCKWARIEITWEQIEREKGRYAWAEADRFHLAGWLMRGERKPCTPER